MSDETKSLKGSLLRTRIIAVLLVFVLAVVGWSLRTAKQRIAFLDANARWTYPYVPNLDRPFEFEMEYYGMRISGNTEDDYDVLYTGAEEKPDLYFMRDAIRALVGSSGVFIDVGASRGYHSLFMSQHAAHVVAFEPYPPAIAQFRYLIERNGITGIDIAPVGLGNEEAEVPFHAQPGERLKTGSFVDGFMDTNKTFGVLPIRIGDDEVKARNLGSVDVLKVDVEGFEKNVLLGLVETLATHRPIVVMELLQQQNTSDRVFADEAELRDCYPEGYEFFHYAEYNVYTGRYRLVPLHFEDHMGQQSPYRDVLARNIVAIPGDKVDRVPLEGPP